MGFKEVQDLDCAQTVSLGGVNKKTKKVNPTSIEGYYIGFKETPNKFNKSGISKLHILETTKGRVGVWGKTDLDRKLTAVEPGNMIRITQSGTMPTKYGDMYKYKVEVDADNTMDVSNLVSDSDEGNFSASEENNDDQVDYFDEDAVADEQPPLRAQPPAKPASTPDAAKQARVQALLSGKKSS